MQSEKVLFEKLDGAKSFIGFCPKCEAELYKPFSCKKCGLTSPAIYHEMKYCYACGQALSWEKDAR